MEDGREGGLFMLSAPNCGCIPKMEALQKLLLHCGQESGRSILTLNFTRIVLETFPYLDLQLLVLIS